MSIISQFADLENLIYFLEHDSSGNCYKPENESENSILSRDILLSLSICGYENGNDEKDKSNKNMTKLEFLKTSHNIQNNFLLANQAIEIQECIKKGDSEVMVDPTVADFIKQLDDASNKIAARIQALIDSAGLNAETKAAMQTEVDKIAALGADPANPVPVS